MSNVVATTSDMFAFRQQTGGDGGLAEAGTGGFPGAYGNGNGGGMYSGPGSVAGGLGFGSAESAGMMGQGVPQPPDDFNTLPFQQVRGWLNKKGGKGGAGLLGGKAWKRVFAVIDQSGIAFFDDAFPDNMEPPEKLKRSMKYFAINAYTDIAAGDANKKHRNAKIKPGEDLVVCGVNQVIDYFHFYQCMLVCS
jgi:hypothetical protein